MDSDDELINEQQMRFLKRHWKMTIVFAVVFAVAVAAAVLVLLWFLDTAQTTALVPSTLGEFSIGYLVTFVLHLIFWELVLVGSWVLVVVLVILYKWYFQLPEEERRGWPKRGSREEGDVFGFFIFIAFLLIVWIDGRWNLPFNSWTLTDWIYTGLAAVGWVLVIFGIPIAIYFFYWISTEGKKET